MSYDEETNKNAPQEEALQDDAIIAKLIAAGISEELIAQTRATHANWRALLRAVDAPDDSASPRNLDQLFQQFLPS